MSVHTCQVLMGSCRGQRKSLDLLKLELQVFVSHLMWPLEADGQRDKRYCFILTYVYDYPREVLMDSSMVGRVRRANCELNLSLVFTMAIVL